MEYDTLLSGCCEVGRQLLRHGAEIRRAEDTVLRLLAAYGLEGEVFAIPNCIWASAAGPDGKLHAVMRRVPAPAVDIEAIERLNELSRRLCAEAPEDPAEIGARCARALSELRTYPVSLRLAGYFMGAFCFALFFGGGWAEGAAAGLAGLLCGACLTGLERLGANGFLATVASAFTLGSAACALRAMGAPIALDLAVAGSLMVLVPGLVFTNFMDDLLRGDLVAGVATFVRAVLSAGAIALGVGASMALLRGAGAPGGAAAEYAPALYCVFAFFGCLGFCAPFNARGAGALLCCLGGALSWAVYLWAASAGASVFLATLLAAAAVCAWSEWMARVRRCPASSYLVIGIFPLVPGLSVYQAMDLGLRGDTAGSLELFFRTVGIAGCLALGLLAVSAAMDLWRRLRRAR